MHVVFAGLSMTDPNIVAALLSQKGTVDPALNRYVIVTPESPPRTSHAPTTEEARSYLQYTHLRSRAVADHLGITPIFLNSIAQNSQLFFELALARDRPKRYLATTSDLRYGNRLIPFVRKSYEHFGMLDSAGRTGWIRARQRKLSDALEKQLQTIRSELVQMARELDNDLALGHVLTDSVRSERFGLFLWVRKLADEHGNPEYALELAGASTYEHRDGWSQRLIAPISPMGTYAAGEALYFGNVRLVRVDASEGPRPMWKSILACPVNVLINGGEITCGAITLNSHSPIRADDPASGPGTVLNHLRADQVDRLVSMLQDTGSSAFPNP